ncbi:MAG TPA: GIY-YIG nuclease family protein [Alphaproteobacteria bacterium]|jgi:putative endonuclease|nr:GIY-YIG nuclease family protein [Alphaproteobacteria bacterium]
MTKEKQFAVYLLSSGRNGTIYIGMTSNLPGRIWQHKNKVFPGFTARHDCDRLVYFEMFDDAEAAIQRERRLKEWRRAWKVALIEELNPRWEDLYPGIAG